MEKLKTPIVIVNFKAFNSAIGKNSVELAKICEQVAKKLNVNIAVAVQTSDISQVASAVSIPVFAQHVDFVSQGAFTGSVLPEAVKSAGAVGSLVNHSEKPLDIGSIKKTILRLQDCGMLAIACAGTSEMAVEISKFNPDVIAIEPPELIGGDVAVSSAKPEVLTDAIVRIKRIPVICGAGIKT